MAYTLPSNRVQKRRGPRTVHRRAKFTLDGSGAGEQTIAIPCPGRLIGLRYGTPAATNAGALTALTSGALTIKADTTAGAQVFTDADLSSVNGVMTPVGTTSVDEGRAATAATDAFSGGFPVRQGVHVAVASGTAAEVFECDMWFALDSYIQFDLVSTSGADGAGTATEIIRWGGAGNLVALALDFQNQPATTDIIVYADEVTTGAALFSGANSATDLAPSLLGRPGADEAAAASAATDGTQAANCFMNSLVVLMTGADAFTSGDEKVVCEFWIQD